MQAQFTITVNSNDQLKAKDISIYTLDGSKDILYTKAVRKGSQWKMDYKNPYIGMIRIYFPEINYSINAISENKDINISLEAENNKVREVIFLDESNKMMDNLMADQNKRKYILPALYQMFEYYKPSSDFYKSIDKEINRLTDSNSQISVDQYPFIHYYITNYNKFVEPEAGKQPTQQDIISFLANSNGMLETSSLMRPVLLTYLKDTRTDNADASIDDLLQKVNVETPRGQNVLSELIDIFDAYGNETLKNKYLAEAKNLKCTVNDRLTSTIQKNDDLAIGGKFPDYVFQKPLHTTSKSIYDVKSDKKIIIFWSSGCSHCEEELPKFIPWYNDLKTKNIQIIGLSLDTDQKAFSDKALQYPWINDTELRGWNSSFVDTYNVHATPTYFILDSQNKIVAKPEHYNNVLDFLGLK